MVLALTRQTHHPLPPKRVQKELLAVLQKGLGQLIFHEPHDGSSQRSGSVGWVEALIYDLSPTVSPRAAPSGLLLEFVRHAEVNTWLQRRFSLNDAKCI